jgi:hypothetical protein
VHRDVASATPVDVAFAIDVTFAVERAIDVTGLVS